MLFRSSLWLGEAQSSVFLSDTVGFIRDLPHKLVDAFEATLQEAVEADLLLHVIDCASPQLAEQQAEVERVLDEIDAGQVTQILVYNKCDLLEESRQSREASDWIEVHPGVRRQRVFVSATTGEGLAELRQAIAEHALSRLNSADAPSSESGVELKISTPGSDPITGIHPHQHA